MSVAYSYRKDLKESMEARKICNNFVTVGKFSLVYMGLRAIGQFVSIGPEFDLAEPMILDSLGVIASYIGGCCWVSAKMLQRDEKRLSKNYKKAIGELEWITKNS